MPHTAQDPNREPSGVIMTREQLQDIYNRFVAGDLSLQTVNEILDLHPETFIPLGEDQIRQLDFEQFLDTAGIQMPETVESGTGEQIDGEAGAGEEGSSVGTGPPPGGAEIIGVGDETIVSGLPLFNAALRNMLSNIFTNALGTAARDVSAGVPQDQILNTDPENLFSSFLPGFLGALGLDQEPGPVTQPGAGGQPDPGATQPDPGRTDIGGPGIDGIQFPGPAMGGGAGQQIVDVPQAGAQEPPAGVSRPDLAAPGTVGPVDIRHLANGPSGVPRTVVGGSGPPQHLQVVRRLEQEMGLEPGALQASVYGDDTFDIRRAGVPNADILFSREQSQAGASPGQGALGFPTAINAGPEIPQLLFNTLVAGGRAGASPALGTAASIGSLIGAGTSLFDRFFGQDDMPQPQLPPGQPFEPAFNTPNSLQNFLQFLQVFGPGGGVGPNQGLPGASPLQGQKQQYGASPTQGLDFNTQLDQALQTRGLDERIQSFLGPQTSGVPGQANNPLTQIAGAFSLPSFQGQTFAPSTPLQRQATDFASEFLRANPFQDTANQSQALQELTTTGGRFDLDPVFGALEDRSRQRLGEESARLNEQFGAQGLRFGSDVARGQADLSSQFLTQESLQRQQAAQSAFENAMNRRLQALQLGPQLAQSSLQPALQAAQLGEFTRAPQEQAIQRQMAEFARTQGALFPLLLQFALTGTEGDSIILGEGE